jgi:bifunctional non-homologous end joining protein LigD
VVGNPLPVLRPMLATTGQPGGDQGQWSYEVKWDGWRALVYVDGGLRVRTRTGRLVSDSLPELASLVEILDGHGVILDGELVACPQGKVDFYALAPRMMHTGRMARWAAVVPSGGQICRS